MQKEIPETFKKYLAGFFDGDGSIGIEKQQKNGYCLRIKFSQSNINLLEEFQKYYPYLKIYTGRARNNNQRPQYELRAAGIQIQPLINDLLKYSILKYEQLLEAQKMFQFINIKNTTQQKQEIYENLKKLKKESKNKPYERLNVYYIAGLFDAEGCITGNHSLTVKITQKSDIQILHKIADFYKYTNYKIDNYAISFKKNIRLEFLNSIKDIVIYKKDQIINALNIIYKINVLKNKQDLKNNKKIFCKVDLQEN